MYDKSYGNDKVEMIGHWNMVLTGPDGAVKDERSGKNVVVTNGLEFLASFMNSAATAAATFTMRYVAIGTDSTSEAVSNTALGTELSRHTGTVTYTSGALYEVVATFAAGSGTGAIVEYGLFSANSGGTMFSRDTESVINKAENDTLTVTTKITVA
jgi:hypothetical protein